jgi:hypothetical protein
VILEASVMLTEISKNEDISLMRFRYHKLMLKHQLLDVYLSVYSVVKISYCSAEEILQILYCNNPTYLFRHLLSVYNIVAN